MAAAWWLAAIVAGALVAIQTGVNGQLGHRLGHPLAAAFVSFVIGTVGLAIALPLLRVPFPTPSRVAAIEPPLLAGGLLGAVFVTLMIALAGRMSLAVLMGLVVAGQSLAALVIDRCGWLGHAQQPLTLSRVAGATLVVAGVLLLRR